MSNEHYTAAATNLRFSRIKIAEALIFAYIDAEMECKSVREIVSRWPRVLEVYEMVHEHDDASHAVYEVAMLSYKTTLADMLEVLRSPQFDGLRSHMHNRGLLERATLMLHGSQWRTIDEFIAQGVKP